MGYRSQNFVLKPSMSPVTIRLQAEPTRLRDVIVKAPDIEQRSDTLVYYTSKYARKQDRNIGDVLKRLPGIEVEDNGTIKYNGELSTSSISTVLTSQTVGITLPQRIYRRRT